MGPKEREIKRRLRVLEHAEKIGNVGRRKIHTKRYQKQVPGHHIQVDVKFLKFLDKNKKAIKRYQYTSIDDATRVRALKSTPVTTRLMPVTSLITLSRSSSSGFTRSARTGAMNSRRSSTGTLKTRVSDTFTSSLALLSLTARWNAHTDPTRRSFIN